MRCYECELDRESLLSYVRLYKEKTYIAPNDEIMVEFLG